MIYTSTELFNAFAEDTRQIMVRVTINGAVFDNDNISTLNLEYGSMDGANFSLGSTFASSLKITFAELVEGLAELDEIEVEMGAVLPNGAIEYVPMGTFIINEEVMMDRNNNTTSIDAMDRMVMLGEIYEPTLEGDYARIIDIAVDIANQAGVVVSSDFDRLRTDSIQIPREKTLRESIGIIAQFEVGFATFNRDGELAIRRLNDPDFNITPEDYTMKGLVKNEVPFRLNGIQCQIGDGEDDVLQAGTSTGNQIILNNPSMTQEHLDRIYTELSALNYYPFTLDWYGHPALEAGDWIEIEDLQGNKFKTPNLHYTLDFNGGLKAKSQAETTSSSEVVYQYKSPLKQEIHAIAARLSASSGNHVYDDLTEPENPKEGDLWFKPEGPDTLILKYTRLEDGTLDWVEELNTGDTTKNADAIAAQQQEIEDAKQQAKLDAEQALADAKAHAESEDARIRGELESDIGGAIETAEQAKQDAVAKANQAFEDAITHAEAEDARIKQEIGLEVEGAIEIAEQAKADAVTKANQALADAKAHADSEILQFSEHFDGVLAEVESDVVDAQATADSAVEQIDTAVTNAGFTSLDDTLQNMNHITMNAEQNAQQAITNASDAYGLAQTSISEAQTAQANSLTALSEAEDALVGVSNLDIRVDEVEAELELKADNTFLTEDNEVITLSNAITLNAYRFSSDMSRIESRVESLVGEINLVILRDAFEGTRLIGGEVFPNAYEAPNTIDNNTMSEMIDVEVGEQLALSKESTDNDNFWRINFYLNDNYVSRIATDDNQHILTIPSGVNRMWVSYPKGSKPQIVRGTEFLPYRPNLADQMTTNEMVIFRNEYDEYADQTERRLSAIDTTGGSLDVLNNRITTEAGSIRTDMTALINTKVDGDEFAEFYQNEYLETAQEVSRKISLTDVRIGGRNLLVKSGEGYAEGYSVGAAIPGNPPAYTIREYDAISNYIDVTNEGVEDYYTFSKQDSLITDDEWFRIYWISKNGGVIRRDTSNENVFTTKKPENAVTLRFSFPKDSMAKVEKGNIATGYSEAFEDTDAKIGHVQTEWTQAHDMFKQTVSDDFGLVNDNVQTLENSLSAITNPVSGRLSIVEQVADGLQDTVMDTTTGLSATRTQMAEGFSQMVSSNFIRKRNFENGMTGNWGGQGIIENLSSLGPINGMTKAFKWATRNAFEEGNVFDVSPGETYYVEFVVNTFYAKYPVRFGLNTYGPLGENVGFNVMIEVPSGQPTQKVTGTITIPTTGANTPYTKARPLLQINGPNGSDLGFAYATALVISPNANNSQITQLADNINLRVTKEGLLSQINIEADRTLIQSDRLVLDANSVVFTGSAFIPSAQILSLHADKINAGTIDTARLDATEIVAQGLTADVIEAEHIKADTAIIEKLFATEANIDILTAKVAFIDSIKAVEIDASKITSGTIKTALLNATDIVAQGLTTDVIESTHIETSTATIDKLFADEAMINRLTTKTAFVNSIKAVEIDAGKITSGTIDVERLNASDIVTKGLTTDVIESTHILADTALIDKLFADEANINTLTAKTAFIDSIKAVEIGADKITSGELDAGKITVVNLDVSSLSGETAEFVQAGFNSISGTTSIDGDGISIQRTDGSRSARLGVNGYEFWLDGAAHGTIGIREYAGTDPLYLNRNSISLYTQKDSYLSLSYQGDKVDDGYGYVALSILGDTGDVTIHRNLDVLRTLNMNGQNTLNQNAIRFGMDDQVMGRIFPVPSNNELQIRGHSLLRFVVSQETMMDIRPSGQDTDFYTNIDMNGWNTTNQNNLSFGKNGVVQGRIFPLEASNELQIRGHSLLRFVVSQKTMMDIKANGTTDFYTTIDMNGYNITNQSDYRLKRDIDDTELNSLASIKSWNIVDFNWIDDELNKRNGRQLGVIAQDTPDLAMHDTEADTWSINSSKQIMMNSHAIQQLYFEFDERVESNESKIHKLQQELSKANRRIEELESVM